MRVFQPISPRPAVQIFQFFFHSAAALFAVHLRVSVLKGILDTLERGEIMQAGQLTMVSRPSRVQIHISSFFARVGGWLTRLFGCRHRKMSRPFSSQGQTYRSCLSCGARRQFDLQRWEMQGDFYYRLPTSKHFRVLNGLTSAARSLHVAGVR